MATPRLVDRWELNHTVEKTSYSWIKKATDTETKKVVLLKCIEKDDIDSNNATQAYFVNLLKASLNELLVYGYIRRFESKMNTQSQQHIIPKQLIHIILLYSIRTDAFHVTKAIHHPNVVTLYGYNLNAKYPTSSAQNTKEIEFINTMLFVYEYVDAEFFDLFHYTSVFKENITRTFFKQMLNGLEALHNEGIVHGSLQPGNILIDRNLKIKLFGYGFSNDFTSRNTCYKAPELYLNEQSSSKADIFSLAVILFILLAGYPPFEQACKADKWFKPLLKGKTEKFWKAHQKSPLAQIPDAKDLLTKMFCPDPGKRITISDIKCHSWLKGNILSFQELFVAITDMQTRAEKKRRQDVRKMNDLAQSLNPCRCIPSVSRVKFRLYPKDGIEGLIGEAYTYSGSVFTGYHGFYHAFEETITNKAGSVEFDFERQQLICKMAALRCGNNYNENVEIKFSIEIFKSRLWKDKYKELSVREMEEVKDAEEHVILVVKMKRIQGDGLVWLRLKNGFLLSYCSSIIKGLPAWARKMGLKQSVDKKLCNMDDSYYNTLLKYELANWL